MGLLKILGIGKYLKKVKAYVDSHVSEKIAEVVANAPDDLDTLKEIANYIASDKTGAAEINNKIAAHDNAITELGNQAEELGGELNNQPFEKGSAANSAVLKGGDNQAISENSTAFGTNNVVGLKGFYYKSIQIIDTDRFNVFVSETQVIPTIVSSSPTEGTSIDLKKHLAIGDIISIVNDVKYENCGEIVDIFSNNGGFRVKFASGLPFKEIALESSLDLEDYSIYCLNKPHAGVADLSVASFAAGRNNKAINNNSTAFGFNNNAYGKFSFVEGRDNEAAYAAHAEGRENVASGEQSHSEGLSTTASGNHSHSEGQDTTASGLNSHAEGNRSVASGVDSHAEGFNTEASGLRSHAEGSQSKATEHGSHVEGVSNSSKGVGSHVEGLYNVGEGRASHTEGESNKAYGDRSHVEGFHNETNNNSEHAEGKYNRSNSSTIHSVGIGTSDTDRKNAHEIMQDGRHFIYGVGGYDGTNPNESNDLATVISNTKGGGGMVNITYSELVALRDSGQLIAGMQYRITDYVTTTSMTGTQSAGHQFDIVVTALDSSTLSARAEAMKHAGDTYYTRNLAAWQVWYEIENNKTAYPWADVTNGKGVIYRLIDENGNDCPYDFTNIQFIRHQLAAPSENIGDGDHYHSRLFKALTSMFEAQLPSFVWAGVESSKYWESQNIYASQSTGVTKAFYTFSFVGDDDVKDNSGSCENNIIQGDAPSNIVFFGLAGNNLIEDCSNLSIGNRSYNNKFESGCTDCCLGPNTKYNVIGASSTFISLHDNCQRNELSAGCNSIILGVSCMDNEFSSSTNVCMLDLSDNNVIMSSSIISFGTNCSANKVEANNQEIIVGNYTIGCIIGQGCFDVVFGDYDTYVSKNYYTNVVLGANISAASIDASGDGSFSSKAQNYRIINMESDSKVTLTRGNSYETTIAMNSSGEIKTYCEADLVS